jgi:hypothetical protein
VFRLAYVKTGLVSSTIAVARLRRRGLVARKLLMVAAETGLA